MAIVLRDLTGGLNVHDAPTDVPDDQVVDVQNVLWGNGTNVASRRLGTAYQTQVASGMSTFSQARMLHRHIPGGNVAESEAYIAAVTSDGDSLRIYGVNTAFVQLTETDAGDISSYDFSAASNNKKAFIAYDTAVDRLHIMALGSTPGGPSNTVYRTGLAQPAQYTNIANSGSGSYTATLRYYRLRANYTSGSTVYRRSEPSEEQSFTPSGAGAGVTLTFPSLASGEQGNTWEVEASANGSDFYRIATAAIGTTSYTDTASPSTYATIGELSEPIGDYNLQWSAKFVIADEDRILIAGSHEDDEFSSTVGWTPVFTAPGVGNNERIPLNPTSFTVLNNGEDGGLTGFIGPINNVIYAFKANHIYKIVRTYNASRAYQAVPISNTIGAVEGSVVEGVDETGASCVYFSDPVLGAHRIGQFGLQYVGKDVSAIWETVNLNATVACRSHYIPETKQVLFSFAGPGENLPSESLLFNTEYGRTDEVGEVRKGWTLYTGLPYEGAMCSFQYSIDWTSTSKSKALFTFVGVSNPAEPGQFIIQLNTGNTDDGAGYRAYFETKPYVAGGTTLQKFGSRAGRTLTAPASGVTLMAAAKADFGKFGRSITFDLTPNAEELSNNCSRIFRYLDDLPVSDCIVVSLLVGDIDDEANAYWQLDRMDVGLSKETDDNG